MDVYYKIKNEVEINQTHMKTAIATHQAWRGKLELDPYNCDIKTKIYNMEKEIVVLGIMQKGLLQNLREKYRIYQMNMKNNVIKNGIAEKRFNLTNALNRARKQNIVVRTTSANSFSDDSNENFSDYNGQTEIVEQNSRPLNPRDVSQSEFLNIFGLVTHEVYKEMQNKRVERKRRSTANPHFLYGKGWELGGAPQTKKQSTKRSGFLLSPPSPPHTRQAVRKKQEQAILPSMPPSAENASSEAAKCVLSSFPSIPNLPSGLIIERVSPGDSISPDSKTCVTCKQPGALSVCDVCLNGFHISCHNRPLTHTPHQCPKCIFKEIRTIGSLNVPSGMTVSYVTTDVSEKLDEKKQLEEKRQNLSDELLELQNRHSQLTISLNDHKTQQEELIMTQQSTEGKINQILTFIKSIQQSPALPVTSAGS